MHHLEPTWSYKHSHPDCHSDLKTVFFKVFTFSNCWCVLIFFYSVMCPWVSRKRRLINIMYYFIKSHIQALKKVFTIKRETSRSLRSKHKATVAFPWEEETPSRPRFWRLVICFDWFGWNRNINKTETEWQTGHAWQSPHFQPSLYFSIFSHHNNPMGHKAGSQAHFGYIFFYLYLLIKTFLIEFLQMISLNETYFLYCEFMIYFLMQYNTPWQWYEIGHTSMCPKWSPFVPILPFLTNAHYLELLSWR